MHFNIAVVLWLSFLQIYSLAVSDLNFYTHTDILPHRFVLHSPLTCLSSVLLFLITFDERWAHALWSPLLCNLHNSTAPSHHLAPYITISNIFSNTLSLCCSVTKFQTRRKQRVKTVVDVGILNFTFCFGGGVGGGGGKREAQKFLHSWGIALSGFNVALLYSFMLSVMLRSLLNVRPLSHTHNTRTHARARTHTRTHTARTHTPTHTHNTHSLSVSHSLLAFCEFTSKPTSSIAPNITTVLYIYIYTHTYICVCIYVHAFAH